ncbi:MAG: hypothetical protein IPJ41_06685 [Phycisphaerales bacterium]|nr:hypothetical protein [Phycisphaerales bacterium]
MTAHHEQPHESPAAPNHLDEWHQHVPAEGLPRAEHGAHARIAPLLITFVVLSVGTVIIAVLTGIYTIGHVNQVRGEREREGLTVADPARAYKQSSLASQQGYGWTAEGKVKLPIDRAMEMVIEKYAEKNTK